MNAPCAIFIAVIIAIASAAAWNDQGAPAQVVTDDGPTFVRMIQTETDPERQRRALNACVTLDRSGKVNWERARRCYGSL